MKIVVTGGIASGKTAVTDYLRTKGFYVIDADAVSRDLTVPGSALCRAIRAVFGDGVFDGETLNRHVLRETAFAAEETTARLNALTHGAIYREILARLSKAEGDAAVAIPLYFETGREIPGIDEVWTVACDQKMRIERVCKRDGVNAEQAQKTLSRQWTDARRAERADRVIKNDGSPEELRAAVDRALIATRKRR